MCGALCAIVAFGVVNLIILIHLVTQSLHSGKPKQLLREAAFLLIFVYCLYLFVLVLKKLSRVASATKRLLSLMDYSIQTPHVKPPIYGSLEEIRHLLSTRGAVKFYGNRVTVTFVVRIISFLVKSLSLLVSAWIATAGISAPFKTTGNGNVTSNVTIN